MTSKVFNGTVYYCPRPNYRLSRLDASICQEGIALASKVLLGNSPANVITDEDGCMWISDFPTPELLMDKINGDSNWITNILAQRSNNFESIKTKLKPNIQQLQKNDDTTESLLEIFQSLYNIQTVFLSFVYLPSIDDFLVNRLIELVSKYLDAEQVHPYVFSLLQPPSYFQNILKEKTIINESKILCIPPSEELFLVDGNIHLDGAPLNLDSKILSQFPKCAAECGLKDIQDFSVLRSVVPILFQIGQEDLFIGKAIIIALSHCVYKIAKIFTQHKIIKNETQILMLTQEDLLKKCLEIKVTYE
jgi:hypothetical protein